MVCENNASTRTWLIGDRAKPEELLDWSGKMAAGRGQAGHLYREPISLPPVSPRLDNLSK
jgi:hypothetical protein